MRRRILLFFILMFVMLSACKRSELASRQFNNGTTAGMETWIWSGMLATEDTTQEYAYHVLALKTVDTLNHQLWLTAVVALTDLKTQQYFSDVYYKAYSLDSLPKRFKINNEEDEVLWKVSEQRRAYRIVAHLHSFPGIRIRLKGTSNTEIMHFPDSVQFATNTHAFSVDPSIHTKGMIRKESQQAVSVRGVSARRYFINENMSVSAALRPFQLMVRTGNKEEVLFINGSIDKDNLIGNLHLFMLSQQGIIVRVSDFNTTCPKMSVANSGQRYPLKWEISLPGIYDRITILPVVQQQELTQFKTGIWIGAGYSEAQLGDMVFKGSVSMIFR